MEIGYFRIKWRKERRPGLPLENPFVFYPKWLYGIVTTHLRIAALAWKWGKYRRRIKKDPEARNYMDTALEPVNDDEMDTLEMFTHTEGGQDAVQRARR